MARRVALARAIALDPDLIMYDEPFAGLDPISLGVAANLIRQLNDTLGITSIVVSHDLEETFRIADQVICWPTARSLAQGTPDECVDSHDPLVHQFVHAEPDGPVHFHYPAPPLADDWSFGVSGLPAPHDAGANPGRAASARATLEDLRVARPPRAPVRARWCAPAGAALHAPGLVVATRSTSSATTRWPIIAVSGLFVGFVLALQGYYTLQRYGSAEALGLLVALSLVRELGPVVTALLFAGRAGTSLTAEIGLMKAGEQLAAMEMMAVDPVRAHPGAALLGGVIAMPLLAVRVQRRRHHRRLGGRRAADRRRRRRLLEQMQGGVDVWRDVGNGVVKSLVFGVICTFIALLQGYEAQPTPEGVSRRPRARWWSLRWRCWAGLHPDRADVLHAESERR